MNPERRGPERFALSARAGEVYPAATTATG